MNARARTVPGPDHGSAHEPASGGPPPWERLSARLLLLHVGVPAAPLGAFLVTLPVTGGDLGPRLWGVAGSVLGGFLVVACIGLARLLGTRYRVTEDRVELRSGVLFRRRRSVPLAGVRGVEATARPLHRALGLTSLAIGTGEQGTASATGLVLDGMRAARADELRRQILERRAAARLLSAADGEPGPAAGGDSGTIAALDRSWPRYAPLSVWGVGSVLAGAGTALRVLHDLRIDPLELAVVRAAGERLGAVPLWAIGLVGLVLLVALGAACSTATFVEGWYGYRLERADGGAALRVRRGLLVTRSVSLDRERLYGVEVREPLPVRLARGARVDAVATGLGNRDENRARRVLTPAVPRPEAMRVAAAVLDEARSPTAAARLAPHPRAALRRRVNRGLASVATAAAALAVPGLWLGPALTHAAWIAALALLPLALWLARDAYRSLGHGLHGHYLVIRAGTFDRRTVALRRDEIIGWRISRSPFQRRAGLLTLGAATAAGDGCYAVRDLSVAEGTALAERAVPGLLAPFIERRPGAEPGPPWSRARPPHRGRHRAGSGR
ncbi:PH domain-containing protein [Streptomyces sp. URMC 123]|uniref:PH domain-containing protein n=1 Tax=Streptomyces sp. URMC 123 TaxID=3423403 RepID=UPI003F1D1A75